MQINHITVLELLNFRAEKILSGNLVEKYRPFKGNLKEAVQILNHPEGATTLKLVAGLVKDCVNKTAPEKGTVAVVRQCIGYNLATQISTDVNKFNYHILNIVNLALCALEEEYGHLEGKICQL